MLGRVPKFRHAGCLGQPALASSLGLELGERASLVANHEAGAIADDDEAPLAQQADVAGGPVVELDLPGGLGGPFCCSDRPVTAWPRADQIRDAEANPLSIVSVVSRTAGPLQ
jgi:hypothetical protein